MGDIAGSSRLWNRHSDLMSDAFPTRRAAVEGTLVDPDVMNLGEPPKAPVETEMSDL